MLSRRVALSSPAAVSSARIASSALDEWSDLDRAAFRGKDLGRVRERRLLIAVHQEVAAELLIGIRERPVGDDRLSVADEDELGRTSLSVRRPRSP
jgi:hypothetical protein